MAEVNESAPQKQETRRIVRLLATDIIGELPIGRALRKIKGVSFMFANAACLSTGVDKRKKIGQINETDLKKLESFIKSPALPQWMLNRRKDMDTGMDMHISMADLDLRRRDDINVMKRIHSYKGVRHELGQPVRGQRTRSSFRSSKAVGVSKKKAIAAAKPAPTKKEEKK